MRSVFISILIISAAVAAYSQGSGSTVSGVVNAADGAVVPGIVVRVSGLNSGRSLETTTDDRGTFRFEEVPPGKYLLTASGVSDTFSSSSLIEVRDGSDVSLAVELARTPAVKEVVDVSVSSGISQPVAEIAKTIDVISEKELSARGDISVVDSLRTIPGFRVQQLGGFGRAASVKARGLRNQDTAVLIDGMRFRDPSSITGDASAFLSDLTVLAADRIEVLRGSGSSVYGTNAIGGVIDLRTDVPKEGLSGSAEGGLGGLGYENARGSLAGGTEAFRFSAAVGRNVFTKGIDGDDDANNTGFRGRAGYSFGQTQISGRFLGSEAFVRLNSNPDTLGDVSGSSVIDAIEGVNFLTDADDPDSEQRSRFLLGRLTVSHIFSPEVVFDASYQALTTRRRNENGPLGPGFQPFGGVETSIFKGRVDTFESRIRWSPGLDNLFTAGYEFESEDYRNEGFGPSETGSFFTGAGQRSSTLYAQHLAGFLAGRLQVSGGVRFQIFDVGNVSFSATNAPYQGLTINNPPNAVTFDGSAAYTVRSSGTKFRAHAGNGYRVPSLYERLGTFYSSFSQDFTALGDPGLGPERSVAFDAGIDQQLWRGRTVLSATYFYTRLTDTIGFGFPVPDIGSTSRPFGGYRNEKGGIARGVELSVRATPASSTYVFASYTYTNSDQRTPQVAGTGVLETLGVPRDQFTFVGSQRLFQKVTVTFDLLVSGSYLAPIFSNDTFQSVLYRFQGNRRGDISAAYRLPVFGEKATITLRGIVQNVFDDAYFENGFRTEGRTGRIGLGIEF